MCVYFMFDLTKNYLLNLPPFAPNSSSYNTLGMEILQNNKGALNVPQALAKMWIRKQKVNVIPIFFFAYMISMLGVLWGFE